MGGGVRRIRRTTPDRVHRIGQDKPVFEYKLIAQGTVEERMLELQERKRKIAGSVLIEQQDGASHFNEDDLRELFKPFGAGD